LALVAAFCRSTKSGVLKPPMYLNLAWTAVGLQAYLYWFPINAHASQSPLLGCGCPYRRSANRRYAIGIRTELHTSRRGPRKGAQVAGPAVDRRHDRNHRCAVAVLP
jgi:hypothetical protein